MLLPPGEGVNSIFDAYPKVVNTPQVVETNVNMCPMNSSLQIPRPPLQEVGVGARLMHFVGQWEEISVDTYILEVGYCLEFKELPPPTGVIHTSMPGSIEKVCVIEKEILTLLQKNAIEKVPENEKSLGFYSTIFLTKKKSGGLRPILNLSNLNLYLQRFHFRMETLRSIIKSLQQGEWTIALDLTDAYFHVPIRPSHRRYLRFCFNGQCYQYRALPFGLSTAPRLFTKVVQVIAGHLRQESIHCHQYLDDWLLKNKSRSLLLAQAQKAIDVTVKLGFLINKEKSNLRPSQSFVYLGAHFDLKLGRVFLTQERSVLIQDLIGLFRLHEYLPAQTFLKLLGTMASCIDVIPYAHLHMRPIQMYLLFYWKPSQRDVQSLIPVSSQLISHLEWWTIPQNLFKGVPLSPPSPDMVLTTDASKSGCGAHLDDLTVQGVWSSQEQQLHINNLELLAVRNALHHFCTLIQGKHVLVKSDNSTVIAYINNQGGTKSTDLCMILWHLMQWCIEKGITLTSSHIPRGEEHSSRCAEQENFSTHGMVSERQCSSSDFCNMGISLNRPFRIGQQPQDSSVLFLDSFEEGTLRGCSSNILVRNTGICVSSNSAFIPSTSESEAGGMHTHFDSPSLAQATMVSSSTGSHRFPDRNSSVGYTVSSTKDKVVSSSSRSVQFDSVAYIKQQLKEKGFSKSAGKLLASAVRPGTQRVYKYKHRQFVCWCHKRNEDPVSCSISTVANFLACLFDKGLNYSTICGYRSAISALHEPVEGYKVGEHPRIVALLKGVFNRNPPKRTLLPPWDLRVVLKHIQNHPFEPLNQVDLKFKTMKAVFLLAITTGGRVSDLSLLGYKQPFLRIEKVAPGLRFAPTGLRKQDRPKHFEHEVFVPTYPHNKFLDPVRAVLIYLKATKSLREGSNSLFVTLTEPHNAPSPQTISKWIVNTIKTCYELEGKQLQTVRAHSTRSLSSSWALYSGVAMDRILQAVDWSKDTTFVKFYLKDVEHTVSDFASAVLDVGKDL